jgi:hypothetical protein
VELRFIQHPYIHVMAARVAAIHAASALRARAVRLDGRDEHGHDE